MGAIWWGTRGTCPPRFLKRWGYIMPCSPTIFSLGFVFGEVSKIRVTFVTFCVKCFSCYMAGHTQPSWCWNRVWCGITDHYFINFSFDKMIFSILQVSRDRERMLTASVRHFTLCGMLLERLFSWNSERITAAHVRDHIVQPWFVSCRNATDFAVTLVVTSSETDSAKFNDTSVYYVRKLHFQASLCDVFA